MFLNKIRNIFCVPDTKFVSATNVALAGKRGNICVGNNVSATMSFARAFIVFSLLLVLPSLMKTRHGIYEQFYNGYRTSNFQGVFLFFLLL